MPMDIPEWRNVDRHLFETQILPAGRPAVFTFFDHYVFQIHGDPAAHIARERRGLLGSLSPEQAAQSTATLAQLLSGMR